MDTPISRQTELLKDKLREVPIGSELTYLDMKEVLGKEMCGADPTLQSARNILLREHGIWFETIRGVGIRRMEPEEAYRIGVGARRRIRRASGKAIFRMKRVVENTNGLSPEKQREFATEVSSLGLLRAISRDTFRNKIVSDKIQPPSKFMKMLKDI